MRSSDAPIDEVCARVRVMVGGGPREVPIERVDRFPALAAIVCLAAGCNGVDLADARELGVAVATSAGLNGPDVADLAVGSLIALIRGLVSRDRLIRDGGWQGIRVVPTRSIGALRVGIVGMGAIGQGIAVRMTACGCAVTWFGPGPKPVSYPRAANLVALAEGADSLFAAAPLTSETAGIIDYRVITALGPLGYLVNVGRGGLIDEDALVRALCEHRLAGAGLDVLKDEPTPPALCCELGARS